MSQNSWTSATCARSSSAQKTIKSPFARPERLFFPRSNILGTKASIVGAIDRAADDDLMVAAAERTGRAQRVRTAREYAKNRRAAARHGGIARPAHSKETDQPGDLRIASRHNRFQVVIAAFARL